MENREILKNILALEIISPEGEIYSDRVDEVTLPTSEGNITVLPGHTPLIAKVVSGELIIKTGKDVVFIAISGGFLEIKKNHINILANYAIRSEEIEIKKAEEAKKRAEEIIKNNKHKKELLIAERDLKRSILQLKIAEKYKKRKK